MVPWKNEKLGAGQQGLAGAGGAVGQGARLLTAGAGLQMNKEGFGVKARPALSLSDIITGEPLKPRLWHRR